MNEKSDYEQLFAALAKAAIPISHFVVASGNSLKTSQLSEQDYLRLERQLQQHLFLTQTIIQQKISTPLCLLSLYSNADAIVNSALVGYAKSVRQEYPHFAIKVIGLDNQTVIAKYVSQELQVQTDSIVHIRYADQTRQIEQYEEMQLESAMNVPLRKGGIYLITGGLGKLGFLVASYLAKNYQAKLLLTGRSLLSSDIQSKLHILESLGAQAHYLTGDISQEATAVTLVSHALQSWGTLHGVFHCAGIIQDELLIKKTWSSFKTVFATKVKGAIHLDNVLDNKPLDCFVIFSALVGYLGNVGQCDYVSANAFLNEFAIRRAHLSEKGLRHGKSIAIGWPYWLEGGMRIDAPHLQRQTEAGLSPLTNEEGIKALEYALKQDKPNLLIFYGNQTKILANEALFAPRHTESRVCCSFDEVSGKMATRDRRVRLIDELRVLMAETIKMPSNQILDSEHFSEYGFDSILFGIAADQINQHYAVKITPAIFFSYFTLEQLVDYLLSIYPVQFNSYFQTADEAGEGSPARGDAPLGKKELTEIAADGVSQLADKTATCPDDIAVIGMSCKVPGAHNVVKFWQNLLKNQTNIQPLPKKRKQWWQTLPNYIEGMIDESYCWGGFLSQVEKFDADFFKILPREAQLLDPQQRILLEETWHCFEDAGYKPSELAGKNIGVFVGAQLVDYEDFFQEIVDPKIVTGTAKTMLANRISYHFDLTGPSETIDTSCASSSVAIHKAVQTLRLGECELALAAGVSLLLSPKSFIGTQQLGMLGKDGKSQSFARGGNGMIKGEGVGVLLLKNLTQAIKDGDNIHGIIKGVAVNHNGHSHTITSPNAIRQAEVIQAALKQAKLTPVDISYIETQATGSEMGDMLEFEAYKHVWQTVSAINKTNFSCYLGNLKANIGHLESASGVISVIKVLLALKEKMIPSSSPVKELNPRIVLEETPFRFNHEPISWKLNATKYAGVHNYGFGGVNAHFILAEPPRVDDTQKFPVKKKYIFVLSAKNQQRLQKYAKSVYHYLHENSALDLASLAYTLQVGREEMEERVAFLAEDIESLMRQLKKISQSTAIPAKKINKPQNNDIAQLITSNALKEIAEHWSNGGNVDWKLLYEYPFPTRISIPTYPFAKDFFWVQEKASFPSPVKVSVSCDTPSTDSTDPNSLVEKVNEAKKKMINSARREEGGWQELIRQQIAEFSGLKPEEIDLKHSLFEQGIDSILLAQLLNKLSDMIETDLGERIENILECPSIENIARQVEAARNFSEDKDESRLVAL
jgi:polyketide synthase PksN